MLKLNGVTPRSHRGLLQLTPGISDIDINLVSEKLRCLNIIILVYILKPGSLRQRLVTGTGFSEGSTSHWLRSLSRLCHGDLGQLAK